MSVAIGCDPAGLERKEHDYMSMLMLGGGIIGRRAFAHRVVNAATRNGLQQLQRAYVPQAHYLRQALRRSDKGNSP